MSDISELTKALNRLAQRAQNQGPLASAIANYQSSALKKAFDAGRTPEGEPWQPLAPSTLAARNTRSSKPLASSLKRIPKSRFSRVTGNSIEVGYSNVIAVLHDQGYTIPARTVVPKNRQALYWAGAPHPVKRAKINSITVPARKLVGYSTNDLSKWENITLNSLTQDFD